MAYRYWTVEWVMEGFGNDGEQTVDLVEDLGFTEEEVEKQTDEKVKEFLMDYARMGDKFSIHEYVDDY